MGDHLMSVLNKDEIVSEHIWNPIQPNHEKEIKKIQTQKIFPTQELRIPEAMKLHYYIASIQFHKMITKIPNPALPRKTVINPSDAIESIIYIHNEHTEAEYD